MTGRPPDGQGSFEGRGEEGALELLTQRVQATRQEMKSQGEFTMTAENTEDDEIFCLNEKRGMGEMVKRVARRDKCWADGSEEKLKPRSRQLGRFN